MSHTCRLASVPRPPRSIPAGSTLNHRGRSLRYWRHSTEVSLKSPGDFSAKGWLEKVTTALVFFPPTLQRLRITVEQTGSPVCSSPFSFRFRHRSAYWSRQETTCRTHASRRDRGNDTNSLTVSSFGHAILSRVCFERPNCESYGYGTA